MPKILGMGADQVNDTLGGYGYTSVNVENLGAVEYTLVGIVTDKSGSVGGFKGDLEKMIQTSLEACQMSPRALNLIARVSAFSLEYSGKTDIEEILGFTPLGGIDATKFAGTIDPDGQTPLFEATAEMLLALKDYGEKLYDKQITSNAIMFIITDGDDNNPNKAFTPASIKAQLAELRREEKLESIRTILVGVNDTDPSMRAFLDAFKVEAGLDEYISVGEATKGKLAKLAQFVSRSISSQSAALGTGGPSKAVDFTF